MVSNNDIYSTLQNYRHRLDEYTHKKNASAPPKEIFNNIQTINNLDVSPTTLTSDAAKTIFEKSSIASPLSDDKVKREIRKLNKSLVKAKYKEAVSRLSFLARIPIWLKYTFSSGKSLGAHLNVKHLIELMHVQVDNENIVDTNIRLVTSSARSEKESYTELDDVVEKLGSSAKGTYLLLADKSALTIIEDNNDYTTYTFKEENGVIAVYESKNRVDTVPNIESFLKKKQINKYVEYITSPNIYVDADKIKYIKVETGRTKEGKEFTILAKDSNKNVSTNQYIALNGVIEDNILLNGAKSGTSSYFDPNEFIEAKAKELHVTFRPVEEPEGKVLYAKDIADARQLLRNKPIGTGVLAYTNNKSKEVFLIVGPPVAGKDPIREFPFTTKPNAVPDLTQKFIDDKRHTLINQKEVVSYIPVSAQKKRIAQAEALSRLIVDDSNISESSLMQTMLKADKSMGNGKSSFILKPVKGENGQVLFDQFKLLGRPLTDKANRMYFDSDRIIKVLPEGRVEGGGRIYENFEAYKAAEDLSTSLPDALIQSHLGNPVLKPPVNLAPKSFLFYAVESNPNKTFLSCRIDAGIETYQIGNMTFDKTGEPTFKLQNLNGNILTLPLSKLAKPFGEDILSSQQREVATRLKDMVSTKTINSPESLLNQREKGYLITTDNSSTTFNYKWIDKGYTDLYANTKDFTLRVLPDGRIAKEEKVGNEVRTLQVYPDVSIFKKELSGIRSIKDLAESNEVKKQIGDKIDGFIASISKSAGTAWYDNESTAKKDMEDAISLDLPPNQVVFFRNVDNSSRIILLFQKDGKLQEGFCDVKENGDLLVTLPTENVTQEYKTIDAALEKNSLVKADTILKDIKAKRKTIQEAVDKLKATNGFDSSNTAASRITDELTSHIEEFPSMDKMVGAWMLAEVVEVIPANWLYLQGETINETGRFKLAVNVGDKEEDMKIVEHTVSVNSKGQFVIDNDATKPENSVEGVLSSVGAKKELSLGELKATEAKWNSVEESIKANTLGLYVSAENADLKQVWENLYKAKGEAIITDIGLGEYSVSGNNGLSVDFSTREYDYPGKLVILPLGQPPKIYDDIGALVASEVGPSKPWLLDHQEKLAEQERTAPKKPGLTDKLYDVAVSAKDYLASFGFEIIGSGSQTATVAEPVAEDSPARSPQMQQPLAGGSIAGTSPEPASQQQEPVAPAAQPQAQAPVANEAIGPTLVNMKPAFLNKGKYFKFGGKQVTKAQTALMKEVIAWKSANSALSAQDAKEALKMLLLNDNYEQSEGFKELKQIQAMAKEIIPYPSGVNKIERDAALAWLWEASKK